MTKGIIGAISSMLILFVLVFVNDPVASKERDWNECLEKYDSKWGSDCANCMESKDTYLVSLRNVCTEKIDCMVCVQEKYKNWRCYSHYDLMPRDTVYGYACKGAGRYLYWVKRAGDTETAFPTISEVNSTYTD